MVQHRMTNSHFGKPPSCTDVKEALGKLKSGKAGGCSDILPEMLKVGWYSAEFLNMLTDLANAVCEEKRVPQEWIDAILVPIPKKGNLYCCDNWRRIALLDAVGKLVARIVQLQALTELVLPES